VFDIGFSEIVVCAIVALIVIGPERMPETVRTVGLWIGRFKRSMRETREEIERQIGVDDIRRQLHNEDILKTLEETRLKMNALIEDSQHNLTRTYESEPDLPYHAHTLEHEPLDAPSTAETQSAAAIIDTPNEPKAPL
jgi:sec-independent protein translocase protein TatB